MIVVLIVTVHIVRKPFRHVWSSLILARQVPAQHQRVIFSSGFQRLKDSTSCRALAKSADHYTSSWYLNTFLMTFQILLCFNTCSVAHIIIVRVLHGIKLLCLQQLQALRSRSSAPAPDVTSAVPKAAPAQALSVNQEVSSNGVSPCWLLNLFVL